MSENKLLGALIQGMEVKITRTAAEFEALWPAAEQICIDFMSRGEMTIPEILDVTGMPSQEQYIMAEMVKEKFEDAEMGGIEIFFTRRDKTVSIGIRTEYLLNRRR